MKNIMWNEENIPKLLSLYKTIQKEWGVAYSEIYKAKNENILCSKGCSDCCRGKDFFDNFTNEKLFSIKIYGIEGTLIKKYFRKLSKYKQEIILNNHNKRIHKNKEWYIDKCVFLDDNEHCIIYNVRPYTCRITGLPVREKIKNPNEIREEASKQGINLTEIAEYYEYTCDKYRNSKTLNCEINSKEPWAKRWLSFITKSGEELLEIDAQQKQIIFVPISTFVINALL